MEQKRQRGETPCPVSYATKASNLRDDFHHSESGILWCESGNGASRAPADAEGARILPRRLVKS